VTGHHSPSSLLGHLYSFNALSNRSNLINLFPYDAENYAYLSPAYTRQKSWQQSIWRLLAVPWGGGHYKLSLW
jgi:hypothetical protein